jgi:hypothetical protein
VVSLGGRGYIIKTVAILQQWQANFGGYRRKITIMNL